MSLHSYFDFVTLAVVKREREREKRGGEEKVECVN